MTDSLWIKIGSSNVQNNTTTKHTEVTNEQHDSAKGCRCSTEAP